MEVVEVARASRELDFQALNALLAKYDENGHINFDYEYQAVRKYFLDYVNKNMVFFHSLRERLTYLFEHKYYDPAVFDQYSFSFMQSLYDRAYSKKFRFRTLLGAHKFYSAYALRTKDGSRYLERYEDRVVASALLLARGNEDEAIEYLDEIISGRYQPATPTFSNAGKCNFGELVSCFICNVGDNLEDITRQWMNAAQLSKIGGGVGLCITDVRASGDPIKGVDDRSDGVRPMCKVFEDIFTYVNQLGARPGAGVVWINALHLDAPDLIDCKKENIDEKIRLKNLNIGLMTPDILYVLAAENKDVCLFSPYDIERQTGIKMSQTDFNKVYWDLANNPKIRKKRVNARAYLQEISKIQMESGYPFIGFIDTINRANNIEGYISSSNLCSEILQVAESSVLTGDNQYEVVGRDISCNLGSMNAYKTLMSPDFGRTIEAGVRMCTAVSDMSKIMWVPSVLKGNELGHAIGVGVMNLHGTFAELGMTYGSEESLEFTDVFFMSMRYYALKASNALAKEHGAFFDFAKSKYATGEALKRYIYKDYRDKIHPSVMAIFDEAPGFVVPTAQDWAALNQDIITYGLYNTYLMAIAPTGSISYINDSTPSIHPISAKLEKRHEGKAYAYYPAPHLTNENQDLFEDAFDLGWKKIIDVYAAAQPHVDQGMSLTLCFQEETTTTRDIDRARFYAWRKGVKTLYYIRARQKSLASLKAPAPKECEACSV